MKNLLIRIGYIIVGAEIGLIAGIEYSRNVTVNKFWCKIIFILIAIILALTIKISIEKDMDRIFTLVLLFVFSYPLACILCYSVALIVFIKGIVQKVLLIFL